MLYILLVYLVQFVTLKLGGVTQAEGVWEWGAGGTIWV
jgi:hypothetical protein